MPAHAGGSHGLVDQLLPFLLWVVLGAYLALYLLLLRSVRLRNLRARPPHLVAFAGGLATIPYAALALDGWADRSQVGHMVQHELLLNVAPSLLLLGVPRRAAAIASKPITGRVLRSVPGRAVLDVLSRPILALVLYASGMCAWLLPAISRAVEASEVAHSGLHVWLTASGLAFWFHVVRPMPSLHPMRTLETLAYLLCGTAAGGIVAALLISSPEVLTGSAAAVADALREQRLAGATMMAIEMPLALGFALWLWLRPTGTADDGPTRMRSPRRWLGI